MSDLLADIFSNYLYMFILLSSLKWQPSSCLGLSGYYNLYTYMCVLLLYVLKIVKMVQKRLCPQLYRTEILITEVEFSTPLDV